MLRCFPRIGFPRIRLPRILASLLVSVVLAAPLCAQIDLTAAFSDDATEASVGIFQQPNLASITASSFAKLRFLMRPFVMQEEPSGTAHTLSASGDALLEVFTPSGVSIPLPATFASGSLPASILVSASSFGATTLTLADGTGASDAVRVRAGRFPGLAGRDLAAYPWFEFVTAINENDIVQTALDPTRHAERLGLPYDVWVVAHRTPGQWAADNTLVDATATVETALVQAGGIEDNSIDAWLFGLSGQAGTGLGVPYDVVYDFGQDGTLDPGDLIDGFDYAEAGFYVVHDLDQPGPLATTQVFYSGGTWLDQVTVYPSNLASMGKVPLVIISHGNGHNYQWYDYIQQHLASYGYVVMSHSNNTGPGIESASTTTLTNTDYFLGNLDTIASGAMDGHIDNHTIIWIGHSRGGEGIVRAYDRLVDENYDAQNFSSTDIVMMSAIAPTDFLGPAKSDPHGKLFHFIYGSADGDVSGTPSSDVAQAFHIYERAKGIRQSDYIQGADHNDFNCCGFEDFQGPPETKIGRAEAQRVALGVWLALVKHYIEGSVPAKDYLWRQYEALRPISVNPNTITSLQYKPAGNRKVLVLDDFQRAPQISRSSSGLPITWTVTNALEGRLDDGNTTYTWQASDPMNGMAEGSAQDSTQGIVFDWNGIDSLYEYGIPSSKSDFRRFDFLSFRACQQTRHPLTGTILGDLTFTVTLEDGSGTTSSINFGAYGGGIEEVYQRTGSGTGVGWQNEWETVRIRLTDFEADGSGLDLSDVTAVRFEFGPSFGDAQGRIGLDDVILDDEHVGRARLPWKNDS